MLPRAKPSVPFAAEPGKHLGVAPLGVGEQAESCPRDLHGSGRAGSPSQPTSTAPGVPGLSRLQVCHLISSRLWLFQTNTICPASTEGDSRRKK